MFLNAYKYNLRFFIQMENTEGAIIEFFLLW
jgi:hypothetical protein